MICLCDRYVYVCVHAEHFIWQSKINIISMIPQSICESLKDVNNLEGYTGKSIPKYFEWQC